MNSFASEALPVRVRKRKAELGRGVSTKKARRSITPEVEVDRRASDSLHGDDESSSSEAELEPSAISTPLSPISSKPSPRLPSDLKTKHCPYSNCSKSFSRQVRLNEHLRSHTNTRPYVCPHPPCTKDFLRSTHLKHHIKSAHSDIRDYVCSYDGCQKRFATGTRLKRHHATHEGREKYKCTVAGCESTFRKHSTLQAHTSSVHDGKNRFVCEELTEDGSTCATAFETAIKLKNHKTRLHVIDKFHCTICKAGSSDTPSNDIQLTQMAFRTYNALMAHNKEIHPPTCLHCGLQCTTSHSLTTHVEVQHGSLTLSERKTHFCTEVGCGRGFTKRGNLLVHIRTVHALERAFVCGATEPSSLNKVSGWQGIDACERDFTTKANLEEHIRTAHLGLEHSRKGKVKTKSASKPKKKLKASTVGRLSGTAYDEETQRNIPCFRSYCDFRFSREYDLEIHMQSKHGLADFEIQHLRAERDGHGPSTFGYTLAAERDNADAEAERALDGQFAMASLSAGSDEERGRDLADALEEAAVRGGKFWLEGIYNENDMGEEWDRDEQDMRRLIGDEGEMAEDDETMIDPTLQ